MLYRIRIEGASPIIHNSAESLDPLLQINQEIKEITRKRASNRTGPDEEHLRQLETTKSLWLDSAKRPTIPPSAIRAVIETGARKLKQGPQVREGLSVIESQFTYDVTAYGESMEQLVKSTQFTVPVVVNGKRVLRSRAKFDTPWSCLAVLEGDEELVSLDLLKGWLDIGGRRIGLGDWRPEKSGVYGHFTLTSIEAEE